MDAQNFIDILKTHQSDAEREKIERYFDATVSDSKIIGVRMKRIFDLAKNNKDLDIAEINTLLDSPYYEARMGAVSVMDFQARRKSNEEHRKALFELYLDRHARINNWDLVDRAAKRVIGGYLYEFEKPRDILYQLANSKNQWERRTSIVSTSYFIREGELDETFRVAELLLDDEQELMHKAVGSWLRHAGKTDQERLLVFLDTHAPQMPPTMLRVATQKLDNNQREQYRKQY